MIKCLLTSLFAVITLSVCSQGYVKTRASGYAIFDTEANLEWDNVKGYVTLYKDSVTYCRKDVAVCSVYYLEGKIELTDTKFRGKKYTLYTQPGRDDEGTEIEVRKYVAKNHTKYYDILWIHRKEGYDEAMECSTLLRR